MIHTLNAGQWVTGKDIGGNRFFFRKTAVAGVKAVALNGREVTEVYLVGGTTFVADDTVDNWYEWLSKFDAPAAVTKAA